MQPALYINYIHAQTTPTNTQTDNIMTELAQLKSDLDKGLISKAEYTEAREALIAEMNRYFN